MLERASWCCHAGQEAQLAWQRMALPVISALHFQKAAARRTQSSVAETPQASPSEPERGPGAAHAPAWASMYCWGHPPWELQCLGKTAPTCALARIAPLLPCAYLCSLFLQVHVPAPGLALCHDAGTIASKLCADR